LKKKALPSKGPGKQIRSRQALTGCTEFYPLI